jgi:3-dehydroquinate dehydratase-2
MNTVKEKDIVSGTLTIEEDSFVKNLDILQKRKPLKSFEDMKFSLLLINGPNLNMLGKRDPEHYGSFTLADVEKLSYDTAFLRGYKLESFQSNYEGAIIEKIHEAISRHDGIVINPGAFTHYSYAIYDALELCSLPVVEAHISDIASREDFRKISVISPACIAQIKGLGIESYSRAINVLCDTIEKIIKR